MSPTAESSLPRWQVTSAAASPVTALPGSNAPPASGNFCCPFLASAHISTPVAMRKEWPLWLETSGITLLLLFPIANQSTYCSELKWQWFTHRLFLAAISNPSLSPDCNTEPGLVSRGSGQVTTYSAFFQSSIASA